MYIVLVSDFSNMTCESRLQITRVGMADSCTRIPQVQCYFLLGGKFQACMFHVIVVVAEKDCIAQLGVD